MRKADVAEILDATIRDLTRLRDDLRGRRSLEEEKRIEVMQAYDALPPGRQRVLAEVARTGVVAERKNGQKCRWGAAAPSCARWVNRIPPILDVVWDPAVQEISIPVEIARQIVDMSDGGLFENIHVDTQKGDK